MSSANAGQNNTSFDTWFINKFASKTNKIDAIKNQLIFDKLQQKV